MNWQDWEGNTNAKNQARGNDLRNGRLERAAGSNTAVDDRDGYKEEDLSLFSHGLHLRPVACQPRSNFIWTLVIPRVYHCDHGSWFDMIYSDVDHLWRMSIHHLVA